MQIGRNLIVAVMAAVMVGVQEALIRFGCDSAFSVPFPIAIHGGFPIPVLFWAVIFCYCAAVASITGKPLWILLRQWLFLGLIMHLSLLLLDLKLRLSGGGISFSSSSYRIYCELVIFLTLAALAVACGIHRGGDEASFFPFLAVFASGAIIVWMLGMYYYAAALVVLFCASAVISRVGAISGRVRGIVRRAGEIITYEPVFLAVIFVLGMGIRLFYLSRIMSGPDYLSTGSDGTLYDGLARAVLAGQKVTEPLVAGYWLFLALVYKLWGTQYVVVGFVQSVLTSVSCLFMYIAAKNIFSVRVARTVAFICAVSFPIVFSSVAIGHQALDIFFSTLSVMLVVFCFRSLAAGRKSLLLAALTGAAFGLSIATREVNFLYPFLVVVWMLTVAPQGANKRRVFLASIVLVLGLSAGLLPFVMRNLTNLGVAYPVTSTSGADYPIIEHYLRGENPDLVSAGIDLSQPGAIVRTAASRPFFVAGVFGQSLWRKFAALYLSQDYGVFDMVFLLRSSPYYYAVWFYVYALTAAGIIIALRRLKAGLHMILLLFILNRTLVHVFTESQYRHRAPIDPVLIVYFSFALWDLVAYARRDRAETRRV